MLEKLNWLHLTSLITLVLLMWKRMCLFFRKNHFLRCWGSLSLLNWIGSFTLSLFLKLLPKKIDAWLVLWSFFLLRLLCISVNLPYGVEWNTVVMAHCQNLASLSLFCRHYFGRCSSELLNWFLILEGGLLIILIDCMTFLAPFLDFTRMSMSSVSFLTLPDSGILCL